MKMGWMSLNCVLETHSLFETLGRGKNEKKDTQKNRKIKKNEQEYLLN